MKIRSPSGSRYLYHRCTLTLFSSFFSACYLCIFIFIAIVTAAGLFDGCYSNDLISQRTSGPVTIDGNLDEWDEQTFIPIEDDVLYLAAQRDERFYYIAGEFSDKSIGRFFALGGFILLISPDGDQEKNLEMNFAFPGRKHIDFSKGGFFQQLNEEQKTKVSQKLNALTNAVTVVDTASLRSLVFMEGGQTDFQGRMLIAENRLFFEIKVPVHIESYFQNFMPLNKESMFCIRPALMRGRGMTREAEPGRMSGPRRQGEFDGRSPARMEYWFHIKINSDE